ncbi:MAG TPA: GNAT family N-acetyltransferase [Candidatus Hodarchaeales archaeon]|nr:GNAT family N-acetyltransferase [Candidatus Hodarchaeales archaeon]
MPETIKTDSSSEEHDSEIIYRFALSQDIEEIQAFALAALNDTILPGFAKSVGADMLGRIERFPGNVVVAETLEIEAGTETAKIIGYIEIDQTRINEKAFYIRGIYVLPEYRRRGVGRGMLSTFVEKRCKDGQQLRAEAFSDFENTFWESLGFKRHHISLFIEKGKGDLTKGQETKPNR